MIFSYTKTLLAVALAAGLCGAPASARALKKAEKGGVASIKVKGYAGALIDKVISRRVMVEDVPTLVNVFATHNETHMWQSEFWGKWAIGACALYQYSNNLELYRRIKTSVEGILKNQDADGYIGNYKPEAQLREWDVWGRKYVVLGLLAWYDISGDKRAVKAACRQIDRLVAQLDERGLSIVETGNYRGMPSASILNAVMKLYNATGSGKYLELAKKIAGAIESEKGPQILAKTNQGIPMAGRFAPQKGWYNFYNGQKAYEMMSCIQGMLDLYLVTRDAQLLEGSTKAVKMIEDQEINITGSGASMECWYGGRQKQTRPSVHEMETCVTTTWINLLRRMLLVTGNGHYADLMEQSIYNALFASLKGDGSQIDKYTPLEGVRTKGEEQCGLHINCCNANGPRGFAAIPQTMYTVSGGAVNVNLYAPSEAVVSLGGTGRSVTLVQEGDYPRTNTMTIKVNAAGAGKFALRLRIPAWSKNTAVRVAGEEFSGAAVGGYLAIDREWKPGDEVAVSFDMPVRLVRQDGYDAIVRGPVVFARDSRLGGGFIDEVVKIPAAGGVVDAKPCDAPQWAWISIKVPMVLGVDWLDYGKPVEVQLCDFQSAGNTWSHGERYRVWLPEVNNPEDVLGKWQEHGYN